MRLTSRAYTCTVLPSVLLAFYIPHYVSHLHPSLRVRHATNWIWQMFPIWVAVLQQLFKRTDLVPDTAERDRMRSPTRDWTAIRVTVGAGVALSVGVWVYMLSMSPFSPVTIFIPHLTPPPPEHHDEGDWMLVLRNFVQYDHLFRFGGALLWLGYLLADLKAAGMVEESWIRIVVSAIIATLALGPGASVGLGWLWREDVLVHKRHKGAVVRGREGERKAVIDGCAEKGGNGLVKNGHAAKVKH
jgi:hypothetical protein